MLQGSAPDGKLGYLASLTNGDTGLSAGIKDELDRVEGDCRVMLLFEGTTDPGNTSVFDLVAFAGIRVMHTELTGSLDFKELSVQRCDAVLTGAVGDLTEVIDEGTTVFTPLILID